MIRPQSDSAQATIRVVIRLQSVVIRLQPVAIRLQSVDPVAVSSNQAVVSSNQTAVGSSIRGCSQRAIRLQSVVVRP